MAGYAEFEALREIARARVQLDRRTPDLLLAGITHAATEAVRGWDRPPRTVDWDWIGLTKRRQGGFLELAIWHGDVLCGLAYGQAKVGWLELGWLEGNPYGHPLQGQVMDIALAVLRLQAGLLEVGETRLKNPFEELRDAYARRGWSDLVKVGPVDYLCRTAP